MDASRVRGAVDDCWASVVILGVRYVCSGRDAEKGVGAGLYGHPVSVAEVQRGYKLYDRILRPAMAVVGKGSESGTENKEQEEASEGKEEEGETNEGDAQDREVGR